MAIQKLPEEVRSAIRSGIAISSTAQCVTELVLNSLDAGATSITILLDISHFKLEVDDNGSGIVLEDLHHVGSRYYTTKCRSIQDLHNNLKYNGYRGEALASLSESCGFLVIVTRPKYGEAEKTYLKAFTRGKSRKPIETSTARKSHGTTVTVQDFMCHAPVRQKRINPNVDVEEIRIQIEGIALSHPHVSFILMDDCEKCIIRRIPSSSCSLETFTQLYGLEISKHLQPFGPFNTRKLNISGFLSTSSYHNKRLQFIFVNGRLVKGTKIHKLINMIMRKSDVLRGNGPWQELPMPERMRDFLWVSPLKKKDRYCVFMVFISCPISEYDITLDPRKTLIEFSDWDPVFECMEKAVKSFLKEHNLACISSDQVPKSMQGSGRSPFSVIDEMEQLEKEDALGQKLSHFRCPVGANGGNEKHVASGKSVMNMATAIHSIPAKRYLNTVLASTVDQGQNVCENEALEDVGDNNGEDSTSEEESSNPILSLKCSNNKVREFDETELIKFPLLPEDSEKPSCSMDKLRNAYQQYNSRPSVQDSGVGPLGRFKKSYLKNQTTSRHTPDDIQKIIVEEPPPIVRRQAPLEHRVKSLTSSKSYKSVGVNTSEIAFDKSKTTDTFRKGESLLKRFEFDPNALNNLGKESHLSPAKKLVDENKICSKSAPSYSTKETQTESNFKSAREDIRKESQKVCHIIGEGWFGPSIATVNSRRRKFQGASSYHDRVKVPRGHDNGDPEEKTGNGEKVRAMECGNNQAENNKFSFFNVKTLDNMPWKQGDIMDKPSIRGRNLNSLSSLSHTTRKPDLAKLSLMKKHFENSQGFRNVAETNMHKTLIQAPRLRIQCESVSDDLQQSSSYSLNYKSANEAVNEREKENADATFLTSEDFICPLKSGKGSQGMASSKLIIGNDTDVDPSFCSPSSLIVNSLGESRNKNGEILEEAPVLEPYFLSQVSGISKQVDNISDSPPCLLNDVFHSCHPNDGKFFDSLVSNEEHLSSLHKEAAFTSHPREKHPENFDSLSEKSKAFDEILEDIEVDNLKSEKFPINVSTMDLRNKSSNDKLGNTFNLVPMYNSDSEDDNSAGSNEKEAFLQTSGLAISEVEDLENETVDIESSVCTLLDGSAGKEGIINNAPEPALNVLSSQYSTDLFHDLGSSDREIMGEINMEMGGGINTSSSIASSKIFHPMVVSLEERLKSLNPQNFEVITKDASNKITPEISAARTSEMIKSPFFTDSREWDAVLLDVCSRLETTEKVSIQKPQSRIMDSKSGKEVYSNISGPEQKFVMSARPPLFPKGLSPVMPEDSPHFEKLADGLSTMLSSQEERSLHSAIKESSLSADELSWIKWSSNSLSKLPREQFSGTIPLQVHSDVPMIASLLAETEEKKLISESDILSARIEHQSKSFVRVFKMIHPCTFSKEVLSNLKMIGKLDCKFIVAKVSLENGKSSDMIVLFDQHAVDERIRLERLTQEYQTQSSVFGDESKSYLRYKSAPAMPAFELMLDTSEGRLMDSFHEHFQRLGLEYDVISRNEKDDAHVIIKVNEVPLCLLSKELKETGPIGLKEQVHSLIREQVEHLLVTRGVGVFSPQTLRDAINMKACRGAVKFGDSLSDQECRLLLRQLSACDTPFQCAHGRPSMFPIIELKQLNRFDTVDEERNKPRIWRLKKMMEYAAAQQKKVKCVS
ncbi:uncharacterized protein LOC124167898 [Ischnura elegans]|uniref:uncharacterized protein LOC124167898 n=1 Tax=Ischnura elegans TaxID=197161 RepID=UPI001ED8778E|nr:uncharacterized protein LOC124167898 [Ischnura elegans]